MSFPKFLRFSAVCSFIIYIFITDAYANNLSISSVSLADRNPSSDTVVVKFDISWDNSWKTKFNHDAVWVTVRLYDPSVTPTDKKLCQLSASGLNPTGSSVGSSANLQMYVPSDRSGAFLRPVSYGKFSSVDSSEVELTINYSSCGFADSDSVFANVFGLEMVYVPEGSFYAGDHDASSASLDQGAADTDPWYISSGSVVSVSNPATNGYRYVSAGNVGEEATGASFTIPISFPNGFNAFYAMKYELTEGQWVEFINALPSTGARDNRDLTDANHKNSDQVKFRNTINCSGSPLSCSTSRPSRALSYLSWMDLAAFLDWAALRPMTELEYEKMARGPLLSVAGEFAWGTTDITAAGSISAGSETGSESVIGDSANAQYNNVTLSGGDAPSGTDYAQGPLRGGIFARSSATRQTAGGGYYGIMELSGNLKERAVTMGNTAGLIFEGTHGDGILSAASGYEGNATNSDWPGIDVTAERGVTGAVGSGFRGGSWSDQSSGARLRISDRYEAALTETSALNNSGGRGVRTDDSN